MTNEWQPIAQAPKDREILIYKKLVTRDYEYYYLKRICFWCKGQEKFIDDNNEPFPMAYPEDIYWQDLPQPPKGE